MSISKRKTHSKIATRVPMLNAWLRCTICCGTGYVFSSSGVRNKDKIGGIIASMTDDKCESCSGSGFIPYLEP
ncbi:MAG: hypothetical protein ACRD8W_28270 [Nitrososphaeraceae archaeon]